jgi:hypothetical protein
MERVGSVCEKENIYKATQMDDDDDDNKRSLYSQAFDTSSIMPSSGNWRSC